METIQQTSIFITGWPLFLMLATVFLFNFLIARLLTGKLISNKYIKRNSPEFQKALILWFMPVAGAVGLWMLLWTYHTIRFWKSINKWLLLKHA
jgi:hypothetical protein